MSYDRWHCTGAGFDVKDVEPVKYFDFILSHREALFQSRAYHVEENEIKDVLEKASDVFSIHNDKDVLNKKLRPLMEDMRAICDDRAAGPVAAIIAQVENIGMFAPGVDLHKSDVVMFSPAMPWHMNSTEKALTEKELYEILSYWADQLGTTADMQLDCVYEG